MGQRHRDLEEKVTKVPQEEIRGQEEVQKVEEEKEEEDKVKRASRKSQFEMLKSPL